MDNEPQPDALLWLATGSTSTLSADGYIEGTPELIAAIATSRAAIDLGAQKNAYRHNGIQEYLVWQTFENRFSWLQLQAEEFVPIAPDAAGIIRSHTFPGLWLAVPALLEGSMMDVLNPLQMGLASPAHQALVPNLAQQDDRG